MVTVAAASQNVARMGQRQGVCGLRWVGLSPRLLQSMVDVPLACLVDDSHFPEFPSVGKGRREGAPQGSWYWLPMQR